MHMTTKYVLQNKLLNRGIWEDSNFTDIVNAEINWNPGLYFELFILAKRILHF